MAVLWRWSLGMIAVIDYKAGNLTSVLKALRLGT
jgi:imidazoleglycerol phosphate synthase glutamine amidotransferase subunit HisH